MFSNLILTISNLVFGFAEVILSLRILLKLFAASTQAPFVRWVYATSRPLLQPFSGMFPEPDLAQGAVIEFSSLFALVVYAFVGYVVSEAVRYTESRTWTGSKKDKE